MFFTVYGSVLTVHSIASTQFSYELRRQCPAILPVPLIYAFFVKYNDKILEKNLNTLWNAIIRNDSKR